MFGLGSCIGRLRVRQRIEQCKLRSGNQGTSTDGAGTTKDSGHCLPLPGRTRPDRAAIKKVQFCDWFHRLTTNREGIHRLWLVPLFNSTRKSGVYGDSFLSLVEAGSTLNEA
jgi:hypothetical protein